MERQLRDCKIYSETGSFTKIQNRIIDDNKLSWKAKGILTALFRNNKDWRTTKKGLQRKSTDSRVSLENGLLELQEQGYIHIIPYRSIKTKKTNGFSLWAITSEPDKKFYKKAVNYLKQNGCEPIPVGGVSITNTGGCRLPTPNKTITNKTNKTNNISKDMFVRTKDADRSASKDKDVPGTFKRTKYPKLKRTIKPKQPIPGKKNISILPQAAPGYVSFNGLSYEEKQTVYRNGLIIGQVGGTFEDFLKTFHNEEIEQHLIDPEYGVCQIAIQQKQNILEEEKRKKEQKKAELLEKKLQRQEKNIPYVPLAKQLSKIVQSKKSVKHSEAIIQSWANEFRIMVETEKIPLEEIQTIMDWYEKYIGGKYIPIVESGSSFRQKYIKLQMAIKRSGEDLAMPTHKPQGVTQGSGLRVAVPLKKGKEYNWDTKEWEDVV